MKSSPRKVRLALARREGPLKRVHVNRAVVAANRKSGRNDPALTVQTSKGSVQTRRVMFRSPAQLIQSSKPLSCGARVWIETRGALGLR